MNEPTESREITPLVDRLKAVLDAPPGHHVFSTTVDADLLREAIDEIERLRGLLNRKPCTCGYGGFHEPFNERCERNQ